MLLCLRPCSYAFMFTFSDTMQNDEKFIWKDQDMVFSHLAIETGLSNFDKLLSQDCGKNDTF